MGQTLKNLPLTLKFKAKTLKWLPVWRWWIYQQRFSTQEKIVDLRPICNGMMNCNSGSVQCQALVSPLSTLDGSERTDNLMTTVEDLFTKETNTHLQSMNKKYMNLLDNVRHCTPAINSGLCACMTPGLTCKKVWAKSEMDQAGFDEGTAFHMSEGYWAECDLTSGFISFLATANLLTQIKFNSTFWLLYVHVLNPFNAQHYFPLEKSNFQH